MFEIYSSALVWIGVINDYSSMQWNRRYTKAGSFELHAPNNALFITDNIIRNGDEAAVIESVKITNSPTQGEIAEVRGRFLISYLDRRILWGLHTYTGTAENVMRDLVTANLRSLPVTVHASKGYTGNIEYQCSYGGLLAEIEAIAEMSGLGVRIGFDHGFEVYKGIERTSSQSVNSRAIFSTHFENVLSSEYYYDSAKMKNVAAVAGQGEGEDRVVVTVGTETGLDRRETYIDARDIGDGTAEAPIDLSAQQAQLAIRGAQKLSELKVTESFTVDVDPNGNLKYKIDYDLGDIVTVVDMGLTADARITEVKEIYEGAGLKLDLTLGYERMMKIG